MRSWDASVGRPETSRHLNKSKGVSRCTPIGGACGNCPMSTMTLKQGIEKRLKAEIPEVESVESL